MDILIIALWLLACPSLGPACGWWAWIGGSPILVAVLLLLHPMLDTTTAEGWFQAVLTAVAVVVVAAVTILAGTLHKSGVWLRRLGPPADAAVADEWWPEPTAVPAHSDVQDHLSPVRRPGPPLSVAPAREQVAR